MDWHGIFKTGHRTGQVCIAIILEGAAGVQLLRYVEVLLTVSVPTLSLPSMSSNIVI